LPRDCKKTAWLLQTNGVGLFEKVGELLQIAELMELLSVIELLPGLLKVVIALLRQQRVQLIVQLEQLLGKVIIPS